MKVFEVKTEFIYVREIDTTKTMSSQDAFELIKHTFNPEQEIFSFICLNTRNEVVIVKEMFKGSVASSMVSTASVFRELLRLNNVVAFICCHNHPSGDPNPSYEDRRVTRALLKAGELMEIKLLDHIVYTYDSYYSFGDMGIIEELKEGL